MNDDSEGTGNADQTRTFSGTGRMSTGIEQQAAHEIEGGSPEEARLVKACQEGDPGAFNLLVWRWEKPLYNFVYKYVGDATLAEDLVQDTFLRVLRSIGRYSYQGSLTETAADGVDARLLHHGNR